MSEEIQKKIDTMLGERFEKDYSGTYEGITISLAARYEGYAFIRKYHVTVSVGAHRLFGHDYTRRAFRSHKKAQAFVDEVVKKYGLKEDEKK